jgi:AbiV family abortive infection protein
MKKERTYRLTLQTLNEYQKSAFKNASELITEAETLLERKHFARTYYLACAALEESGKAFLAFSSKGRNLDDPGVQKKIRTGFEDHRSKILSSLGCLLQSKEKTKEDINQVMEIAFALEVGRERAMYVDLTDEGAVISPGNNITETSAADCLRLAKAILQATMDYTSTKVPTKVSPFEDKLFCIRSDKLTKILTSEDFSEYLLEVAANDPSGLDLKRALVTYHDKFFSKGKLYSDKLKAKPGSHEEYKTPKT